MGYWSNWKIRTWRHGTALDDDIEIALAFNAVYAEYLRDIDQALLQIGLAVPDITLFRAICASGEGTTADWLRYSLRKDAGQLSRSLRMLESHRVVALSRVEPDRRYLRVDVTPGEGERLRKSVDRIVREIAACLLVRFNAKDRAKVVASMHVLTSILRHRRDVRADNDLVPRAERPLRRAD